MAAASPGLQQRAEQLASTLPPLQVAAQRIAMTVVQGVHGRRRVGQGETFWQFRQFQPGDSPHKIDWRQSAKSQPLFVRETEWTGAQSVWLWRDASPSMRYRSADHLPEKLARADLLTLAVAALLIHAGERVALLGSGRRPASGQAVLTRLALELERPDQQPLSLPLIEHLPRHAHAIFIGDFLSPLPQVERTVQRFAEMGIHGHLLQIVDPAEETLPFAGRIRFEGLEEEGDALLSRVETIRDEYVNRHRAHHEGLAAIASAIGWTFARAHTDRPPQTALLALYMRLADRRQN